MKITTESKVELTRDEVRAIIADAIEKKYRYRENGPRGELANWSHVGNGGLIICFRETDDSESDALAAPPVTKLETTAAPVAETTAADF